MQTAFYNQVRNWIYRNARHLELCLWQYHFENGTKEAVVDALMVYQNEDGGFGNTLEPDNWNPASTPVAMHFALGILRQIDFTDVSHPIFAGIWRYLESGKDRNDRGWRFTVESTEQYAHAPWWSYNSNETKIDGLGITAEITAYILKYDNRQSELWELAFDIAKQVISIFVSDVDYRGMLLKSIHILISTMKELDLPGFDYGNLIDLLSEKVKNAIEYDSAKWHKYVVRPSNLIDGPESPFYKDHAKIVKKELEYLIGTKRENEVWGINWTWESNAEKYSKEFTISENWWKSYRAIEFMTFLRKFDVV